MQKQSERRATPERVNATEFEHCIEPLLKALRWHGNERQIKEALPHYSHIYSVPEFRRVMENLKFSSDMIKVNLETMDSRLAPCLYISENDVVLVLIEINDEEIKAFDPESKTEVTFSTTTLVDELKVGEAYIFKYDEGKQRERTVKLTWLKKVILDNRGLIIKQ